MAFRLGKLGFRSSPVTYARGLHLTGVRPIKTASRNFSYAKLRSLTIEETKIKLKNVAKRTWDGLGTRLQNSIIDAVPKVAILAISGQGYLMYLNSLSARQDKMEARLDKTAEDGKKALAEVKTEVQSIALSQEVSEAKQEWLEAKLERLENEVREVNFLKELWLSAVYQASKTAGEAEKE